MATQTREVDAIQRAFEKVLVMIAHSVGATEAQQLEGYEVGRMLGLFGEAGRAGTTRANEMRSMVETLRDRSRELESEVARFKL